MTDIEPPSVARPAQPVARVMLLMSPATYRASAFLEAARLLNIDAVTIVDMPDKLSDYWQHANGVAFGDLEEASARIVSLDRRDPVDALLAVDDSAAELAARVGAALGLIHNDPSAALAARDKFIMRSTLSAAGVRCPPFRALDSSIDPASVASLQSYPCVVKPLRLSGSRGVIRADDAEEFIRAFDRLCRILRGDGEQMTEATILVEEYLPGDEVALEGLLTNGELQVLALFDKPDPLVGPFFEETIYTTPSRHSSAIQDAIARETEAAARALGLRHGPLHAELRVNESGPWILEVAGRSIGGLCSTILSFGSGMSLEELILRHAVGLDIQSFDRDGEAAGVMMIPIPRSGLLRCVDGVDTALQVEHIDAVEITAKLNYPIVPLPEGASYLGFIFARAGDPADVEHALRAAHERLRIRIDPMVSMATVTAPANAE
ncbi:MAG TPA: ATP-grasp domain-containing protein [Thermomicrobiales bacterium]|nr:ATP-grasp domain-containing protein [Thermomicrobiales bacterium]